MTDLKADNEGESGTEDMPVLGGVIVLVRVPGWYSVVNISEDSNQNTLVFLNTLLIYVIKLMYYPA